MTCPPASTLVARAFESSQIDDDASHHVAICGVCADEIRGLREAAVLISIISGAGIVTDACLSEATLADIASAGRAALNPEVVRHLAECAHCRTRLAGAVSALSSPQIASEIGRLESGPRRLRHNALGKPLRFAAMAAVLAGVVILPQLVRQSAQGPQRTPQKLRDGDATITMTAPPTIVAPRGNVATASLLTWSRVPGADAYAVTIYSDVGEVLLELEASDTSVHVPQRWALPAGERLLWKVAARTGADRWVESELVEFKIVCASPGCAATPKPDVRGDD